MSYIHIHSPPVTDMMVMATTCPDCKKRTRMLCFHQDWYGWHDTCLRCGRQWDDGEWLPLDFRRGVRADNIARAKDRWRRAKAAEQNKAET